jgi:hypothetical protein
MRHSFAYYFQACFFLNLVQSGAFADDISKYNIIFVIKKVKLSLQQAVEAHRVVKRRGSHIF